MATKKVAKKAPAKKKAVAKKAAVKKAVAKKAAVKKKAVVKKAPAKKKAIDLNAIGNFEVEITRSYYQYYDLYDGDHFSEDWLTDPFMKKLLKQEDGLASYWSDGDPTSMLDVREYDFITLHYERVLIRPYGKCKKCGAMFTDQASTYLQKFCTGCGVKREVEAEYEFYSLPKDMYRILNKPENFEVTRYSAAVRDYLVKNGMGRFMCQNGWFGRNFEVMNSSIQLIKDSFAKINHWENEDYDSMWSQGAGLLGICSKCKRDARPLEKFCESCGNKLPWFEELS